MPELPQAIADKAVSLVSDFNARVTAIRSNPDLSPEGRASQMAALYFRTVEAMDVIKSSWEGTAQVTARDISKELFGAAATGGADAISARDADDRVARIDDPAEALGLLERAEQNGDTVLVRAIAQRAYGLADDFLGSGWAAVLETYLASRPDDATKLAELQAAQRSSLKSGIFAGLILSVPMPTEVERMPAVVRAAARGRESVGLDL